MRARIGRVGLGLILAASNLLAARAETAEPPEPLVLPLRTVAVGQDQACAGVGVEAVPHGDPAAPDVAWLGAFPAGGGRARIVRDYPFCVEVRLTLRSA